MPMLRHRTAHTDTDLARCRMCGTTAQIGTDGCCPLGHPAGSATPSPVAGGPAEAGPVQAGPVQARRSEGTPIDEVAPPTIPAESATPADEDPDTASRLDWLDWEAASGPTAPLSAPAALPPPVAKLPPPPAAAAPQLPTADRVPEPDDGRAALHALLAAHHQRVAPPALAVPIAQLRAPGPPVPLASSPATDAHGQDDAHAEARALAELLLGAEADEANEERAGPSRLLAVRIAGAVMLVLLTAAMTAAVVIVAF